MLVFRWLAVGLAAAVWGCATSDVTLAAAANTSPFTLSWTHGGCPKCQTAKSLSEVQFVSRKEAWGIGYNPPGETGAGDYSVLHTIDAGETWRELPRTYVHNDWPRISFADRREGWIMVYDISEAQQRLLLTRDGGAHWRRVSLRTPFVNEIQYLGRGVGFASGFDI